MKKINNTNDLREVLLGEIQLIRQGSGDLKRAKTISSLAGVVLSSAKVDLAYMRLYGVKKNRTTRLLTVN